LAEPSSQIAQCHLGGVFFRLVHEASIVPEASGIGGTVYQGDGGPRCAASSSIRDVLIRRLSKFRGKAVVSETTGPGFTLRHDEPVWGVCGGL
jgi:hypothetical protein